MKTIYKIIPLNSDCSNPRTIKRKTVSQAKSHSKGLSLLKNDAVFRTMIRKNP